MNKQKEILWLLIVVILITMTSSLIFFYKYLIDIDKQYSDLIDKEIEIFSTLENLTAQSNKTFILLDNILDAENKAERDSIITLRDSLTNNNYKLVDTLLNSIIGYTKNNGSLSVLIYARRIYNETCQTFINLISVNHEAAKKYLSNVVEPSFYNYQNKISSIMLFNKKDIANYSDQITAEVHHKSFFMLLIGISPIIMVGFLALLFILILILIILIIKKNYSISNLFKI
jgi:hypothetical protein